MEEKRSYYAIIPANVRYDKNLTPNAKLLYGEITALCNEKGFCWASNKYFSDLYEVSNTSISKWIASLIKGNYIKSVLSYKEGTQEIDKRILTIVTYPIEEKLYTPIKDLLHTPIEEKLIVNTTVSNTTVINNTINNIKARKLKFADSLKPFLTLYGKEMLNDFFIYWTEPNKSQTKLKFELNKTWDVSGRLRTWNKNNFGAKKSFEQPIKGNDLNVIIM